MNVISIWLTPQCNLRCRYCFQRGVTQPAHGKCCGNGELVKMSREVLDNFVGFCSRHDIRHVEFFGGEPLYYPDLFLRAVRKLRRAVKNITLGVVTNGTLLNEKIMQILERHSIAVLLSLDGNRARHNAMRGGFEKMRSWFSRLIDTGKTSIALQAGMIPGLSDNIRYVWRLGFTHVYLNVIETYGWYTKQDVKRFEDEYEQAILGMLGGEGILSCAIQIHDALEGSVYVKECGIIRKGLSCDWNGLLYPCHRAVELGPSFAIGNIADGIDRKAEKRLRSTIERKSFKSAESKKHQFVSFCPIVTFQKENRFDAGWNSHFCEMIYAKTKLVAKHHYAIESFKRSRSLK